MPRPKLEPLVTFDDLYDRLPDEVKLINLAWLITHTDRNPTHVDAEVADHLSDLALRYKNLSELLGHAEARVLGLIS